MPRPQAPVTSPGYKPRPAGRGPLRVRLLQWITTRDGPRPSGRGLIMARVNYSPLGAAPAFAAASIVSVAVPHSSGLNMSPNFGFKLKPSIDDTQVSA